MSLFSIVWNPLTDDPSKPTPSTNKPSFKNLIGIERSHSENLYLDQEWSYRIIKQVGNYGESYERNLGYLLPERGPNNLWKNGGFIFVGDFR